MSTRPSPAPRLAHPATWWRLVRSTASNTMRHRVTGLAAEVAFFALFSFPPTLLAAFAAMGFLGRALGPDVTKEVRAELLHGASRFLTENTIQVAVAPTFDALTSAERLDLISIGLLVALWSASKSADALLSALHISYEIDVRVSLWRRRGLAILYTLVGVLMAGVLLPLLVVGPEFGRALARRIHLESTFSFVWSAAYWPVVITGVITVLTAVYHYSLPWRTPFVRDLPGAIFSLAFFVSGSWAIRTYGVWIVEASPIYAAISAPMVLLTWLYFVALSVLLGAELNATIEAMWPTVERREKRAVLRAAVAELAASGEEVAPVSVTSRDA